MRPAARCRSTCEVEVAVCPPTSTPRGLSLHVEVDATDITGLDRTSNVQCELVRSDNRDRLVHQLAAIDLATNEQAAPVIRTLLIH